MPQLLKNKTLWASLGGFAVAFVLFLYWQGVLAAGTESYEVCMNPGEFGHSRYGWCLGPKSLYLREGQVLTVTYDVKIKRGYLHIHLLKQWSEFGKGTAGSKWVKASEKGEFSVPIRESGMYKLILDGSPDGRGYDLEYSASWSAHAAR